MIPLAKQAALIVLAALISWWFLLRGPAELANAAPSPPVRPPLSVTLTPHIEPPPEASPNEAATPQQVSQLEEARASSETESEPAPHAEPSDADVNQEQLPPPPELGTRRAPEPEEPMDVATSRTALNDPQVLSTEAAPATETPEPDRQDVEAQEDQQLESLVTDANLQAPEEEQPPTRTNHAPREAIQSDPRLLALAHVELSGEARVGFQTELWAAPEQQIEIARAFDEELVLVPYTAIDPEAEDPHYFRLRLEDSGSAQVETVHAAPHLERYRQFRDLFEFEYAKLPPALRALRRSVLSRNEVFVFAALIPTSEWALVIGRRREALAQAGRKLDEVERVTMAYRQVAPDRFDIEVERIDFSDGTRFEMEARRTAQRASLSTEKR